MKTDKREDRFLDEHLCPQVHANDQEGFFQPETYQHDLRHLTKVGRELLTQLKETHDDMRRNAMRPDWPAGCAWPGRTGVSFPALLRFLPVKKTTISLYEAFSRDLERQIAHDLNIHVAYWGPTKYALSVTIHCQNHTEAVRYIVKRPPSLTVSMLPQHRGAGFPVAGYYDCGLYNLRLGVVVSQLGVFSYCQPPCK